MSVEMHLDSEINKDIMQIKMIQFQQLHPIGNQGLYIYMYNRKLIVENGAITVERHVKCLI